jgi:hypothetical protein
MCTESSHPPTNDDGHTCVPSRVDSFESPGVSPGLPVLFPTTMTTTHRDARTQQQQKNSEEVYLLVCAANTRPTSHFKRRKALCARRGKQRLKHRRCRPQRLVIRRRQALAPSSSSSAAAACSHTRVMAGAAEGWRGRGRASSHWVLRRFAHRCRGRSERATESGVRTLRSVCELSWKAALESPMRAATVSATVPARLTGISSQFERINTRKGKL